MQNLHTKLLCQEPMFRKIEWKVQNELITKIRVLPVTTFFFEEFCFSPLFQFLSNLPNVHIHLSHSFHLPYFILLVSSATVHSISFIDHSASLSYLPYLVILMAFFLSRFSFTNTYDTQDSRGRVRLSL